jgi:hypothetical protein
VSDAGQGPDRSGWEPVAADAAETAWAAPPTAPAWGQASPPASHWPAPPTAWGQPVEAPPRTSTGRIVALVVGLVVVALLGVSVVGIVAVRFLGKPLVTSDALEASVTAAGGTLDSSFDPGAQHSPAPRYTVDPPAGGQHADRPSPPGIFTAGSGLPTDGMVVHALEHGYVAIWYSPDLAPAQVKTLERVYAAYPRDVILLPHASLRGSRTPVVATSWHRRLLLPAASAPALKAFVAYYRNKGPEAIRH